MVGFLLVPSLSVNMLGLSVFLSFLSLLSVLSSCPILVSSATCGVGPFDFSALAEMNTTSGPDTVSDLVIYYINTIVN